MSGLAQKRCVPCEGIGRPLNREEAVKYLEHIAGWQISDDGKLLSRELTMKNFMAAVRLVNLTAEVAEHENHHPDFHLTGYRRLRFVLSTHALGGLTENDFILAAKINELPAELKTENAK